MDDNFIKEMEEKLSKRSIIHFSIEDITKMICIIKCLEKKSIYQSNYIKELEEQHKKDCNAINVYINLK